MTAIISLNVTDFWMITLHNKNAYLPGFHQIFGSTYVFTIPNTGKDNKTKRGQQGTFIISRTEMHFLNSGGDKACVEDEQNMEECVDTYIAGKIGCRFAQLNGFDINNLHRFPSIAQTGFALRTVSPHAIQQGRESHSLKSLASSWSWERKTSWSRRDASQAARGPTLPASLLSITSLTQVHRGHFCYRSTTTVCGPQMQVFT